MMMAVMAKGRFAMRGMMNRRTVSRKGRRRDFGTSFERQFWAWPEAQQLLRGEVSMLLRMKRLHDAKE